MMPSCTGALGVYSAMSSPTPPTPLQPCTPTLSNRCAALIKISKYSKALDDADTAIRLRPEWDKGYYRKASVLEAMDNQEEVHLYGRKTGMYL